jgi:hypothetical protein
MTMAFFKKSDEMERDIVSKSEKIALTAAKLGLLVWCIVIIATQGVQKLIPSGPFLLLTTTSAVQFGVMYLLRWMSGRGGDDEK